jgi:hypothetical protein
MDGPEGFLADFLRGCGHFRELKLDASGLQREVFEDVSNFLRIFPQQFLHLFP